MTSAQRARSAMDIDAGTMTSITPARRRAATVRRRRRVATIRMGCGEVCELFKDVGSDACGDGFGPIVGGPSGTGEPCLLRTSETPNQISTIQRTVPRSIVIGNGNVLVGFDSTYTVRDIYYPRVGDANQTMGNACRTGFFIDGKFAWLDDPAWDRDLGYAQDSLVSNVTLKHPRLGITVSFEDFIDMARNWFIRIVEVVSPSGFNVGRV